MEIVDNPQLNSISFPRFTNHAAPVEPNLDLRHAIPKGVDTPHCPIREAGNLRHQGAPLSAPAGISETADIANTTSRQMQKMLDDAADAIVL